MQSDKENILLVDSVHLEFGQNQVLIQEQKKNTFPIKSREDLIHHGYILR